MWGINLEWWILYFILVLLSLLVFFIFVLKDTDKQTEVVFRGFGMLHEDLEEIKRIIERTRS